MTQKIKTEPAKVRDALMRTGCESELEMAGEKVGEYLVQVVSEIDEFVDEYTRRFGEVPDPFRLLDENPDKATAFFQAVAGSALSLEMRLMIWRVLAGARIVSVDLKYTRLKEARLRIVLNKRPATASENQNEEVFESDNLWDFQLLQHFAMLALNGKPILEGFFAFHNV
jgi:hypothetical protein